MFSKIRNLIHRRPDAYDWPKPDMRAVPLSPLEAQLLIHAYQEKDRLMTERFWAHTGSAYARDAAESVVKSVALAGALGHGTIPVPVNTITMLDIVLKALVEYTPYAKVTKQFRLLMLKMQGLSALSARNGWFYEYDSDARAIRWVTPPMMDGIPQFPQIEA